MEISNLLKLNEKISLKRALQVKELFEMIESKFSDSYQYGFECDNVSISWNDEMFFYFSDGIFSHIHDRNKLDGYLDMKDTKDYERVKEFIINNILK